VVQEGRLGTNLVQNLPISGRVVASRDGHSGQTHDPLNRDRT
jgi:hypothetical protein